MLRSILCLLNTQITVRMTISCFICVLAFKKKLNLHETKLKKWSKTQFLNDSMIELSQKKVSKKRILTINQYFLIFTRFRVSEIVWRSFNKFNSN